MFELDDRCFGCDVKMNPCAGMYCSLECKARAEAQGARILEQWSETWARVKADRIVLAVMGGLLAGLMAMVCGLGV